MDNSQGSSISARGRFFWFVATAAGWTLGLTLGLAFGEVLGRYANVWLYDQVGDIGSFVRDIFTGLLIGVGVGIFQRPVIAHLYPNFHPWPLKSAAQAALGFFIARLLGSPVVTDVQSGPLFSLGFYLPPTWLPTSVGLAHYSLGGPVAGLLFGISVALCQPPFVSAQARSWPRWILFKSLPAIIGITIGTISGLVGFDLLIVGITTAISFAVVDAWVFSAQMRQLTWQQAQISS